MGNKVIFNVKFTGMLISFWGIVLVILFLIIGVNSLFANDYKDALQEGQRVQINNVVFYHYKQIYYLYNNITDRFIEKYKDNYIDFQYMSRFIFVKENKKWGVYDNVDNVLFINYILDNTSDINGYFND